MIRIRFSGLALKPLSPAAAGHPIEIAGEKLVARTAAIKSARRRLATAQRFCWIARGPPPRRGRRSMVPFFIQIKCHLGKSYEVANKLADAEIASEIYSTAGDFDLLVKFYIDEGTDIGHFVNEKVQTIPGIQDTRTIITFKAF
jgi:DNA-binding Lrp family transcriptional regulator